MTTASVQAAFQRFEARLRSYLRGRVQSLADVDDLLQSVFLRLIEQRRHIDESAVGGWLFSVARHAVVDQYRRDGTQETVTDTEEWADPESERTQGAAAELAQCLVPMIASLAPQDGELLERIDLAGGSQTELAHELGVSVSTVKSRVQRARQRLASQLAACCRVELDAAGLPRDYRVRDEICCKSECASDGSPSETNGKD